MVTVKFHRPQAPAVIQQRNYLHMATQTQIFFLRSPRGGQSIYVAGNKKITFPPIWLQQIRKKKRNRYTTPNSLYFPQILSGKWTQSSNLQVKRWINHWGPLHKSPGAFYRNKAIPHQSVCKTGTTTLSASVCKTGVNKIYLLCLNQHEKSSEWMTRFC